ncbi:MAG: PAS domain-containing protein [Desulfamplus sp.]|nr:PAS domain-containing protein [Desulfamplus sp.]MBF0412450.1 PAS domain-containing protein [Desulfamplus sp.]
MDNSANFDKKDNVKNNLSDSVDNQLVNSQNRSSLPTHYVAIGASAGGLEALEKFFMNMPGDSTLAFIVIQHLSPDYKSLMVEILSKRTPMEVYRAEDGLTVTAGCIYLIPPKKNLTIFHGKLILSEQDHSRGLNLPIDIFFRSLAEDQAEKAVGIILSGTGSDGMRGVRAIKECGGMVMVQSEESAKFDGMPRAAISTGLSDFVLPPEEMPSQLLGFIKHPYMADITRSDKLISEDNGITRIFALIREKCKIDFTYYKPATVMRRVERRMMVNQMENLSDYVKYLTTHAGEVDTLYRELLIGVTNFFRDPHIFESLSNTWLPRLLEEHKSREFRVWVAGGSTGEEAYTLAILIKECMETLKISRDIKIFVTDIDRNAIMFAQAGTYHESIAADIHPKYLSKYFFKKDDTFQISRSIREMVVFAQHNLIKDPPFTKIDLISCRNLLIYFQPILQKKVLEFFSFSLNPQGILLLGSSETTGEMSDYFIPLDSRYRIYQSRRPFNKVTPTLTADTPLLQNYRAKRMPYISTPYGALPSATRLLETERIMESFLTLLSQEYVPLAMIVNEQMEVVHVLGNTEGLFKVPQGAVLNDISKMAAEELAIPIFTGIQKVFRTGKELRYTNIAVGKPNISVADTHLLDSANSDSATTPIPRQIVKLIIKPMFAKNTSESFVVVFVEKLKAESISEKNDEILYYDLNDQAIQHINDLKQELQFTRESLQATVEELETSNEELQATNEELLASNEELQSTNQELQSTNEELHTVNIEYQNKILELTELNNDVENLLSSSQIGKLILDENFEIRRFSSHITKIFKILDSDIGRPISHLTHSLKGEDIMLLLEKVIKNNIKVEQEVETKDGKHYLMRIIPYQTGPHHFAGAILSFIDITLIKKAQSDLKISAEKYRTLFETMTPGVVYQDREGRIISVNPSAEKLLGLTFDQMQGRTSMDPRWRTIREDGTELPGEEHPSMQALATGSRINNVILGVYNPLEDAIKWLNVSAIPLYNEGEYKPYQVYATFDDITELVEIKKRLFS